MKSLSLFSTLILASTLIAPAVFASDDHSPEQKREHLMETMAKNMKAMGGLLKGKQTFDADKFTQFAHNLAAEANKDLMALFPAGSGQGTDAKPAIWNNLDDFKARATELKNKADGLVAAAATGEQAKMAQAQGELGRVCKGCHQKYKAD